MRIRGVIALALAALAIPALAAADSSVDVYVTALPSVTVGAGEPFTWEPGLRQCNEDTGACAQQPPTIEFSTTLPSGVRMIHAGFRGNPGKLDNCLSNCSYTFDPSSDRTYDYTLVAATPGTYQLSIAITHSSVPDSKPANNKATTTLTVVPLKIKLAPSAAGTPHAGKRFTWVVMPTSAVTGAAITAATASCAARLPGKTIGGKATRTAGKVSCSWNVPASSAGKRLVATVKVGLAAASATVTRSFVVQR